jgi:hypothetical protein
MIRFIPSKLCGEHHKCEVAAGHADTDPSFFTIVLSNIGLNEHGTTKHFFRIREIESMRADVGAILGFVPLKYRCNSKCSYAPKD